jgi:hypothetical protein
MSALAELTELLHLAHIRPEKLRLEGFWYRHWGRLGVMGDTWEQGGYGMRLRLEDGQGETVNETVQPQEETEYRTLSWWRGQALRVTERDASGQLTNDRLITPIYGGSFTPRNNTLWEYTPTFRLPNVVDAEVLEEPLLEPAFLLSAFTLEATGRTEVIGRRALTLRAKPRSERSYYGPLGLEYVVIADDLTAAVDLELGILLTLEVRF